MPDISIEQIRNFRLHSHHLDDEYKLSDIESLAGACGLQNTPPGAWEAALYNRAPGCSLPLMEHLLYNDKTLLQAWSMRGAPIVFPASESGVFLSALASEAEEPWIYTPGITLALDFLEMDFKYLFDILKEVLPLLDKEVIISKSALDQTLAEWMHPLLPVGRQKLWSQPSMYGNPEKQTVGGAVASFMLRPASFNGLVVFGERKGSSPSFTSFKNWTGRPLAPGKDAVGRLVQKYLHCYGPATADTFSSWLGCSGKQGRRMWNTIAEEMEAVMVCGKKAYILSADKEQLLDPAPYQRELLLLGGHDPFLDQRDRIVLQPEKSLHKQIWRTVTNPGAVLYRGEITGIWTSKKTAKGMDIKMTLWTKHPERQKLFGLAEKYADFRQQKLLRVEIC